MIVQINSGFTACPACTLAQRYMEPYNAIPTVDGRVYCYECKHISSPVPNQAGEELRALPGVVFSLLLALMSLPTDESLRLTYGEVDPEQAAPATYKLINIGKRGLDLQPYDETASRRASAAVAQGNVDVLLQECERTRILLGCGVANSHSLKIDFLPDADFESQQPVAEFAELDRLSDPESRAVRELTERGFAPVASDLDSMIRRIVFTRGEDANAVRAELTWYAL